MIGAIIIHENITERKRIEEELRFRNIILSTQQETSIDGILVVDNKGKWLSFNQRFIHMWGITPEVEEARSSEACLTVGVEQVSRSRAVRCTGELSL